MRMLFGGSTVCATRSPCSLRSDSSARRLSRLGSFVVPRIRKSRRAGLTAGSEIISRSDERGSSTDGTERSARDICPMVAARATISDCAGVTSSVTVCPMTGLPVDGSMVCSMARSFRSVRIVSVKPVSYTHLTLPTIYSV